MVEICQSATICSMCSMERWVSRLRGMAMFLFHCQKGQISRLAVDNYLNCTMRPSFRFKDSLQFGFLTI